MREHEYAGAVGGLGQAGLDAARTGQGRLLIRAARPQRQLDRPGFVAQRSQVAGGVHDRRQDLRRNAVDLEQGRVELGRAELGARCGSRVGGEAGAETVADERVDRPHPQRPGLERLRHRVVVLEQPGQLAGGEVGVERHPAALDDLLGIAALLQPVEHLL